MWMVLVIVQIECCIAEYPLTVDNRTYYIVIYPSEHMKGESYTIMFMNYGNNVELNTHSQDISMGTYYENSTHKMFEYSIMVNIAGGWKTFTWDIYDSGNEIIEVAYVDIHVLLDQNDEASIQQQIETRDKQIRDLEEQVGIAEEGNATKIYIDRTFNEMIGEWVEFERKESVLVWLWIGSIPSMFGVYAWFRLHKLSRAQQSTQTAIKMKSNFWELTFEKLEDIIVIGSEGYPRREIEVRQVFQNELLAFGSMFSNRLIDWLVCVPESIKGKFKNVHWVDMDIKGRIERIRTWAKFTVIAERYDVWAQFIRTVLIPACVMYPEFWREQVDPLVELYETYTKKARELIEPRKATEEATEGEIPELVSRASEYMRGGKSVTV